MSLSHTAVARSRRGTRRSLATAALALLTLFPIAVLSGAGDASAADQRQPRRTDDFVIATFNVLGRSHTDGHDRRRGGFDSSSTRMMRTLEVLRRTAIDVVGFQELQRPQLEQFRSRTDGRWGVFSGSRTDSDNSVAWRRDRFSLVRGWSVPIPYFHGNRRRMPVVELQSRRSGQHLFVMNVHNPADARGNAGRWRRMAVAQERRVTSRLTRREHSPVLLTGDMNDRAPFFCSMTRNGVMHAAVGGSHGGGRCHAPESGIDWVLGNQHVAFRSHRVDRSRLVSEATDHPVVSAHVRVR
jgi:endonuclease/exonuclease/phosphatase family metal-dependent hydrolase